MVHLVGCLYKHVYLGTSLTCFPHQTDVAQVQLVFAQIRGYINYSLDLIAVPPPHHHPFSHAHCKQVRGASCCLITRSARPTQPWSGLVWSDSTGTATASAVDTSGGHLGQTTLTKTNSKLVFTITVACNKRGPRRVDSKWAKERK